MKEGKIVFITGATGGIGKATAHVLAQRNYRVVIHGRDPNKTAAVCEEIKRVSGNQTIDFIVGDLFLMSEVAKVAETFISRYGRLDVLINNAGGIMGKEREETDEGVEKTVAVNLLAPFLLTDRLLGLLKKSEDARIINVSSNSHRLNAKPDLNDIELIQNYNPLRAYGNAKLFLIWASQHLDERLGESNLNNITVNSLHPGAVATNFGVESNLGGFLNVIARLIRPFFKTPERGSQTIVYLATSNEAKFMSGKYYEDNRIKEPAQKYFSRENESLIWKYCTGRTKNFSNKP